MRYWIAFIFCWSFLSVGLLAQSVVGKLELEDMEHEDRLFPYQSFDRAGSAFYIEHETVELISPGSFVHLWMPDWRSSRRRMLTRYNLLLEEAWTVEMELNWEEYILELFHTEKELCVLSYEYEGLQNLHMIRVRSFDLEDGAALQSKVFYQYSGKQDREVFLDFSPDEQLFVLYHFNRLKDRRVGVYSDFLERNGKIGTKISRAEYVNYRVYNLELDTVVCGLYPLADRKITWLNGQVDNDGNFYLTGARKHTQLSAYCFDRHERKAQLLTYDAFPEYNLLMEPYTTGFPPTVGQDKKLYIAYADRLTRGRTRGTKAFQVVTFDFAMEQIDLLRRVEITSTLLVAVEKQRERFGLPPLKRFDGYMIREIFEMPDRSTWLLVQNFDAQQYGTTNVPPNTPVSYEHEIEEMILFEFNPQGKIRQALIVPSAQRNQSRLEKAGDFYSKYLDQETGLLTLLSRESSGERLTGPERIYFRYVNLNTSQVSERKILYEGERRNQYLILPYTVWHNNQLVSFVMMDGELADPWLITVNTESDEEYEAEENSKKDRRRRN
jgi:hypothetical protein